MIITGLQKKRRNVLEHTTTRLYIECHGLTSEQEGEETVYIDKNITLVGGDSKRIRLRYKYATRPAIYTMIHVFTMRMLSK